jgi:FtsP/CotA-like multicopper oxidase with cupredoxin domain
MSNRGRAGLIVLAVAVVAVAFIALRPSDSSDKADDPADNAADTTATESADGGGAAKEPTATAESAPPPPQEITLRDGVPQGGVKRIVVTKGDEVRLQVRTNETGDDIHLHGYDIEKKAAAGAPANFRFKADIEGVFEIESHTAEDAGREPLIARLVVEPS